MPAHWSCASVSVVRSCRASAPRLLDVRRWLLVDRVRDERGARDDPGMATTRGDTRMKECGVHYCARFGQRPRFGLWLHNLVRHWGK